MLLECENLLYNNLQLSIKAYYYYWISRIIIGNTLLEGVCIRLTLQLHNHDMTYVMNMKEVLCMFMTTVIMCHSLSYDIFNANMTLFEMSLL